MTGNTDNSKPFAAARQYDLGINWDARFKRELPVLMDIFGPPGELGLLDAACGPGRHLVAMAERGYRMTGLDASPEMLEVAKARVAKSNAVAALVHSTFEDAPATLGEFDGIYCLGNSLAAAGSEAACRQSFATFAKHLRPGGRLFVQILNFEKLRRQQPAALGPRACEIDGALYVSTRVFFFRDDVAEVTVVTHCNDGKKWELDATHTTMFTATQGHFVDWCRANHLKIDAFYGGYDRAAFDVEISDDLILVATKEE